MNLPIANEWSRLFPFIYFSLVQLFIHSTSIYEEPTLCQKLCARSRVCHWCAGVSETIVVTVSFLEYTGLEVTLRIQYSGSCFVYAGFFSLMFLLDAHLAPESTSALFFSMIAPLILKNFVDSSSFWRFKWPSYSGLLWTLILLHRVNGRLSG